MRLFNAVLVSIVVAVLSTTHVQAQEFFARMTGANETPAILSNGSGTFKLSLDKNTNTATYELTYSGLSSPATQAHIHFSKVHVAGGIIIWLCQTATNPSPVPNTPTCPSAGGTVTGTITANSVVAVPAQLVSAGDFDALTYALFTYSAYANVHTTNAPAGEIRGQIRESDRDQQ